jgi:hypothetical protein
VHGGGGVQSEGELENYSVAAVGFMLSAVVKISRVQSILPT